MASVATKSSGLINCKYPSSMRWLPAQPGAVHWQICLGTATLNLTPVFWLSVCVYLLHNILTSWPVSLLQPCWPRDARSSPPSWSTPPSSWPRRSPATFRPSARDSASWSPAPRLVPGRICRWRMPGWTRWSAPRCSSGSTSESALASVTLSDTTSRLRRFLFSQKDAHGIRLEEEKVGGGWLLVMTGRA